MCPPMQLLNPGIVACLLQEVHDIAQDQLVWTRSMNDTRESDFQLPEDKYNNKLAIQTLVEFNVYHARSDIVYRSP